MSTNFGYQLNQDQINLGNTSTNSSTYLNNSNLWNNQQPFTSTTNTTPSSTQFNQYNQLQQAQQIQQAQHSQNQQSLQQQQQQSHENEDRFALQLKVKETQIESLEHEVKRLNETFRQLDSKNNSNRLPQQIPSTLNEIFITLSNKYDGVSKELEETKLRLEGLVTAISLNPSNSITNNGRYDELEVSHKILTKLENLKRENEELLKELSFGKVKQLDNSLNLLKDENETLKKQNQELQKKLQSYETKK